MKNAVIVVPVYTSHLSADERLALSRLEEVMGAHPIVVVSPEGLLAPDVLPQAPREYFPPEYFRGLEGYNRLMLAPMFYQRFAAYDYVMIYQTDCWVFVDRLDAWCAKGYDYVGAPWLPRHSGVLHRLFNSLWRRPCARLTGHGAGVLRHFRTGNGGLSLRRVEAMVRVLTEHADLLPSGLAHINDNEDVVISMRLAPYLRIPAWHEALDFAVESRPDFALRQLGHTPMGCHGWSKPAFRDYWCRWIEMPGEG